jgi:hypothetical protein
MAKNKIVGKPRGRTHWMVGRRMYFVWNSKPANGMYWHTLIECSAGEEIATAWDDKLLKKGKPVDHNGCKCWDLAMNRTKTASGPTVIIA